MHCWVDWISGVMGRTATARRSVVTIPCFQFRARLRTRPPPRTVALDATPALSSRMEQRPSRT